jgi:hypothetical protein
LSSLLINDHGHKVNIVSVYCKTLTKPVMLWLSCRTPCWLSRHISWSVYADANLDSLATSARGVDVAIRYDNFVETIRSSALAAQTRPLVRRRTPPSLQLLWWDAECDRLNDAKLLAFRNFRGNGSFANYEEYKIAERNLCYTCKTKKIDSWRRYCATMTYETRLTDICKMTKRLRGSRFKKISRTKKIEQKV